MKNLNHSKYKNTGILFELLTRQITADIMQGEQESPAMQIIKKHFDKNKNIAKELIMYQTLINERYNNKDKAQHLVSSVCKLHKKLNEQKLKTEKYELIKEIKNHYDLKKFFSANIDKYKLYAAIYCIFEEVQPTNVSQVVKSKFTVLEHLNRKSSQQDTKKDEAINEYLKQDKDIRLLAYKAMIDSFNNKYSTLSVKQKAILKEYINNISNTTTLRDYVKSEAQKVKNTLQKEVKNISDPIVVIKIKEVTNMLDKFDTVKKVKDNDILSLLLYHNLLKELKNAK